MYYCILGALTEIKVLIYWVNGLYECNQNRLPLAYDVSSVQVCPSIVSK